jgi:acetyl-CoA synthetase
MSDFIWTPPQDTVSRANVTRFMKAHGIPTREELHHRPVADVSWFWDAALKDLGVEWYAPYRQVLDRSKGIEWASWFLGGKINIVHNCLDRHQAELGGKPALIWEGDDGATRTITYNQLDWMIHRLANLLLSFGIRPGDAVGIYMPMVPEIVAAFFACSRSARWPSLVFSARGPLLAVRLADAEAKSLPRPTASRAAARRRP